MACCWPTRPTSLRDAGLQRITVSLDTLSRETFTRLTRADELARVRDGLAAAARVFPGFKIDTVLVRGVNERRDRRTGGRGERARRRAAVHRVHGRGRRHAMDAESGDRAHRDSRDACAPRLRRARSLRNAGLRRIASRCLAARSSGSSRRPPSPFCRTCDRSRLTADGVWYLCLYAQSGLDLRDRLRRGASDGELAETLRRTWLERADRGAEERLAARDRQPLVPLSSLKKNPHLEMHTRGG